MAEPSESKVEGAPISWQAERVPYLAEYLGLWMYEADRFLIAVKHAQGMDIARHVREARESRQEVTNQNVRRGYAYEVSDGIATVQLSGTLMKHVSSFDESTSTVMLRNSVRQMQRDASVKGVILVIDSPGGTVSGAYDLADDVKALAAAKPTYAYAEDLCASGAFLQASQCRGISANANALIGSIGTYGAIYDYSKMFEAEGVKAILLSSGGMKGLGTAGLEISQEQIDYLTAIVKKQNDLFVKYVAEGRNLSRDRVEALADGRVHLAQDALRMGLIDKVESGDALFQRVWREVNSSSSRGSNHQGVGGEQAAVLDNQQESGAGAGGSSEAAAVAACDLPGGEVNSNGDEVMSQVSTTAETNEPKPASITELKQAFAEDPGFALECAEKALTLMEAKAAYSDKMAAKNRELAAENAKLKEAASEKTSPVGVAAIATQVSGAASTVVDGGDAAAELEQRIEPLIKAGKTRQQAVQKVFGDDDELRQRYVKEAAASKAA